MTKKKKTIIALIIFALSMILSSSIGIRISINRMLEYHDARAEAGLEEENHYLGDIESVNRPGLYGVGFGILCFGGVIVSSVLLWKQRKPNKVSEVTGARSAGSGASS